MDINTHAPGSNADFAGQLYDQLRQHLLEDVMPFWMRHAIDPVGGLNTCIRDDGTIVNRDKWLWSQWRAVWVFSKLYNDPAYHDVSARTEWLELARHIYQFATQHGWDEQHQGWVLRLSGDGEVLDGYESIYVDGFAIMGLTEYVRATGDEQALAWLRRTTDATLRRLEQPHHDLPAFPYPIDQGVRVHGMPMMFSLPLWELGQLLDDQGYRDAAVALSDEIFAHFYRPDRDVVLERIGADHSELPAPRGTAIVPGHVIEDMWFQIHIARERGDTARIQECCRLIRRHLELGWDDEFGGIFLAVDADGREEIGWDFADSKLWWPHTETLYALLLAYEQTGEDWCLPWYQKVHDYSFAHYPVAEHGEWRQKLDRRGQPFEKTVALPVKDPFHLPRALIYCVEALAAIKQRAPRG